MVSFIRDKLPDPVTYFENQGLKLKGPSSSKWKTTSCVFHGGHDSMRVNVQTGAFKCMNCQEKGGDVLAYQMLSTGTEFIDAAKALNAWTDDGKRSDHKPSPISARMMLEVVAFEVQVAALIAADMVARRPMTEVNKDRLFVAAGRINLVSEDLQHG